MAAAAGSMSKSQAPETKIQIPYLDRGSLTGSFGEIRLSYQKSLASLAPEIP